MTAAGRPRCALLIGRAPLNGIHGVTAKSICQSPKITGVLRLSSPPTNTFLKKAGLDYTLEGRDPLLPWAPAFAGVDRIFDVGIDGH